MAEMELKSEIENIRTNEYIREEIEDGETSSGNEANITHLGGQSVNSDHEFENNISSASDDEVNLVLFLSCSS